MPEHVKMDNWDPREEDFHDKIFNSYTKGPGRNLSVRKNYVKGSERHVQLYVTGIPQELTEDGLESLFGRAGSVIRVKKMTSKRENTGDTFGFITMGSLSDAERAIATYDGFKINKFTLRVNVSLSKEEIERKKQEKQDLGLLTARGFDEALSDSDSSLKGLNNKPNMMNGVGKAGAASSAIGAGRGKKLKEITQVSPGGYAKQTLVGPPQAGSHPSRLDNLTVQVDKVGCHTVSHSKDGIFDSMSMHTPVGRGKSVGRGNLQDIQNQSDYREDFFQSARGRGGPGRGNRSRGRGNRGRGGYYRDYYDNYDGGYGGYQQPHMGPGMGFPGYPMPVYVADPSYVGVMNSSHLLQPAYNPIMNSTMMNTSMQQAALSQQAPLPQQTPLPHQATMQKQGGRESKILRQECSVCGKLGLSRCSKCKIPYCSAACQEEDWPEHRNVCLAISKEKEASDAFSDFDVTVGDELIPQVKKLMEKATGDIIEVTKKSDHNKKRAESERSRGQVKRGQRRDKQSDDDRSSDRKRNESGSIKNEDRNGERSRADTDGGSGQRVKLGDKKSGRNSKDDKACFNCGETTHMRSECPKPNFCNAECFSCHQKGHISKDCPEKQGAECYNCHERGHFSKDCPQKQENQTRNASSSRTDNRKETTSTSRQANINDEEWDDEPVMLKPVTSPKQSKPMAESTPKASKIATKKKSIPSPPPKKSLKTATMPLNQEIMVVITSVEDPGHFYLQMAIDETQQLQDLMAVMHQTFENSPSDVNSVLQGEIYGARFSLDGSWNRAQVVSISGDSIVIQFLDFGNRDTVKFDDLRQLTNEMMKLPAQGVMCALEGIMPKMGNSWGIADIDSYITPDTPYYAECKKVIDTQTGKVNMILMKNLDGENIAEKLLSANLVNSKTANSSPSPRKLETASQQAGVASNERLLYGKDLPKFVDRLRVNVEYPLMIADAKTPTDFSIQILDEENTHQFTAFNMKFNEECQKMSDTEYRPKAVGELVASQFSQEIGWYRAEVLELVSNGAKVLYIDYLNSETVTFNMMRKAPTMCANFPIQGISSCMHDVTEPEDGKWPKEIFAFYQHLSQSALLGTVKEIRNDTVTMELKELSGESVNEKVRNILTKSVDKSPTGTGSKIDKIRPGELPLDGSKVLAVVTNVSAIDSVYVQEMDASLEKKRNQMMLELNQSLSGEKREPYEPVENEYVAAVYVIDGSALWYRALVKVKVSKNNFMVLFVDYGNEECVSSEAIAPLEPRLMALPAMAVRCQLAGSEDIVDEHTLTNLKSLTDNRMYVKAVDFVKGLYKVEMFLEDGTNVNEAFEFRTSKSASSVVTKPKEFEGIQAEPTPKVVQASRFNIAESNLSVDGSKFLAKVVLIDNLASFYIHRIDDGTDDKLIDCLKSMQLHYRDDEHVYNGKIGEYVAALYDDGSGAIWYRAKILDTVENAVMVSIIDYGNVGLVGIECIRQLKKEFTELPAVAIRCKLNGSTGEDKKEIVEDFQAVQSTNVNVKAIQKEGDTYLVNLYLLDALETSVAELLQLQVDQPLKTSEKVPSPISSLPAKSPVSTSPSVRQSTSPLEHTRLPLNIDVHAVTYVIESLKSFYVQKADDETQKDLATMMIELAEACQASTREHRASAGEIVAALFEDGGDANWYRGQVIELVDSKQCKVMFLDYGNTEHVQFTDIRRLETRFLNLPRMAIHCALAGVTNETESMLQKFKTISNVPMTVCALSEQNGIYEVEVITSDNVNMNKELALTCSARDPMSPSTEIVDHLPKAISPGIDRLPKKVTSPPKGERKAVFTQTLAKSRPTEKEFIAVITSVVRPNLFHCQVYLEGEQSPLQDLQFLSETMQLECEADCDKINTLKFEVGELCCAKYPVDNNWYRASVLEIFPDNTVKVEYVDFGNQTEVSTSNLRPVTEDYTRLPLLAFRCSLHGISPTGGKWTKEVVEEMRKFQDKQLIAKVINVNKDVYELDLTDKDTKVNMAQYLVATGLATDDAENEGMSEMEKLRREKELLQRQLEDMHAKMAAIQKVEK